MGNDNSGETKIRYLEFWIWEYARRHHSFSSYVLEFGEHIQNNSITHATFKDIPENRDPRSLFICHGDTSHNKFHFAYDEKNSMYNSSSEILADILTGCFKYKYPCAYNKGENFVSIVQTKANYKKLKFSVELDFSCPVETVITEIKAYYAQVRAFTEAYDQYAHLEVEHDLQVLKRNAVSLGKIRVNDLARAIGLWLWDYVDQKKISWVNRGNSYRAFHDKYHGTTPGMTIDAYRSNNKLDGLLEATSECIEKLVILPMG